MLGIELNDRAVAVARDGRLLTAAPSAVLRDARQEQYGNAAWGNLRRVPGQVSVRHIAEIAERRASPESYALLTRELRAQLGDPGSAGEPTWIALAQRFDTRAMGELLSLLRGLDLNVAGFVDAAAASSAWLALESTSLVVDLGLHSCSLTLVTPVDGSQQLRRAATLSFGYLDLLERWLALAAEAMVRRTRFDPLHDARQEQQLFDLLPGVAAAAAAQGEATLSMQVAGTDITLQLAADQFVTAAAPLFAQLSRSLQELRPVGAAFCVVAPARLLQLPGGYAPLAALNAAEIIGLPDGAAACAASSLHGAPDATPASVRYLTRVANAVRTDNADVTREPRTQGGVAARAATHVIYQGRAREIDARGLVLGRDPESSPRALKLPEGIAGLSRRHCTLVRRADSCWIIDHSSHGSFIDGEAVAGRAALHAGSVLRLGTPGIELPLIAVD